MSDYTYDISRSAPPSAGFDDAFQRRAEAALEAARESPDWGADASQQDAPTRAEVRTALASLRGKLHKAPGKDGVTNWMLVWGGDALLGRALEDALAARQGQLALALRPTRLGLVGTWSDAAGAGGSALLAPARQRRRRRPAA